MDIDFSGYYVGVWLLPGYVVIDVTNSGTVPAEEKSYVVASIAEIAQGLCDLAPKEEAAKEEDEDLDDEAPEILDDDSTRRLSMPGEHGPVLRMMRGFTGPPLGDVGRSLAS